MEEIDQIQKIIEIVNQRPVKNYHKMNIEEISKELREVMEFEQKTFQKIEELEDIVAELLVNGTGTNFYPWV